MARHNIRLSGIVGVFPIVFVRHIDQRLVEDSRIAGRFAVGRCLVGISDLQLEAFFAFVLIVGNRRHADLDFGDTGRQRNFAADNSQRLCIAIAIDIRDNHLTQIFWLGGVRAACQQIKLQLNRLGLLDIAHQFHGEFGIGTFRHAAAAFYDQGRTVVLRVRARAGTIVNNGRIRTGAAVGRHTALVGRHQFKGLLTFKHIILRGRHRDLQLGHACRNSHFTLCVGRQTLRVAIGIHVRHHHLANVAVLDRVRSRRVQVQRHHHVGFRLLGQADRELHVLAFIDSTTTGNHDLRTIIVRIRPRTRAIVNNRTRTLAPDPSRQLSAIGRFPFLGNDQRKVFFAFEDIIVAGLHSNDHAIDCIRG